MNEKEINGYDVVSVLMALVVVIALILMFIEQLFRLNFLSYNIYRGILILMILIGTCEQFVKSGRTNVVKYSSAKGVYNAIMWVLIMRGLGIF